MPLRLCAMATAGFLCAYLCLSALAQEVSLDSTPPSATADLNSTVLPLTEFKVKLKPKFKPTALLHPLGAVAPELELGARLGTAFCVDPECRFIGTNYHVAASMRVRKIKGIEVVDQYLATGLNDRGVSLNHLSSGEFLSYNLSRDLAMFELLRPLPHHHGRPYSLDDMRPGQKVDIYCYPRESITPKRSLVQFHGEFRGETDKGLLAFAYELSGDKAIRGGASGGVVVDRNTGRIVGILSEMAEDGSALVFAVPAQTLADFVNKVRPYLAESIFPNAEYVSPVAPDFYPKFVPPRIDALQQRPEEPPEVKMLRSKAQQLADSIRDFIAVQTFAWGSGNSAPLATGEYEVRVLDGQQTYREYPDGRKLLKDHGPLPPYGRSISTGNDWADLPKMVGTEWQLKVKQAPNAVVNGRPVKVFQFRADIEDGLCQFEDINDYYFFSWSKIHTYSCYGEVWTDQDINILRISQNFEMRGRWKKFRSVVTYGWLRRKDEAPRLIPITVSDKAEWGKRVYWCRGEFINYQVFTTKARILSGNATR